MATRFHSGGRTVEWGFQFIWSVLLLSALFRKFSEKAGSRFLKDGGWRIQRLKRGAHSRLDHRRTTEKEPWKRTGSLQFEGSQRCSSEKPKYFQQNTSRMAASWGIWHVLMSLNTYTSQWNEPPFLLLGSLSRSSHLPQVPKRSLVAQAFLIRWHCGSLGPFGRWRHNSARLSWWSLLLEWVTPCSRDRQYPSNSPRIQVPHVVPGIPPTDEDIQPKTSRGKTLQRS